MKRDLYEDLGTPAAFSSPRKFRQITKSEESILSNKTYQKYRRFVKKHPRCKSITYSLGVNFQADLATVSDISRHNAGTKFLLILIG